MAEVYSKVYGIPAKAVFLDHSPQEGAYKEWVELHQSFVSPGYWPDYLGKEQELTVKAKSLYPGLATWEQWLKEFGLPPAKED